MEDDEDICRVCRSEGTREQPLFHPCKCSGSIRYVHQDCLLEWLEHSNKRYCDLCKHNFSFTPIYSDQMPETIPKTVLINRAIEKLAKGIQLFLRGILVATIWLVLLPYFTIWIWRLYFWIGETFAFRANGLETPMWNTTSFFSSRHNLSAIANASSTEPGQQLEGISLLLAQNISPERQWISKFILDCFEGQIISLVVVVVFVAIFLLREWVDQNQEGEGLRVALNEGVAAMPGVDMDQEGAEFAELRMNVEHAVERFIAAQHHIEAVVEGEADLDVDAEAEAPTAVPQRGATSAADEPWNLIDFQSQEAASRAVNQNPAGEQRARFFWETENASEAGPSTSQPSPFNPTLAPSNPWMNGGTSSSGSASGSGSERPAWNPDVRPPNERLNSNFATRNAWGSAAYDSVNSLDVNNRRPASLDGSLNEGLSFGTRRDTSNLEDEPASRVGYVYDSLNQTYHPDTRWVPSTNAGSTNRASTSNWARSGQGAQGASGTDGGEGSSSGSTPAPNAAGEPILSRTGTVLYWKEGIPLTYDNVYLNLDGSEMSFKEKVAVYENLCAKGDLNFADVRRLPALWRTTQVADQAGQLSAEARMRLEQARAQTRREIIRQANALAAVPPVGAERPRPLRPNVPAPAPAPLARAPVPLARAPVPPAPAAADAAAVAGMEDEIDDMNVEELDGILEVIGMHGSYWMLLQNSLLMSALICASLGLGVWIPFMIGKTTLLMNPFNVLRIPMAVLGRLTDPIIDFTLDRLLPFLGSLISKSAHAFASKLSPVLSPVMSPYLGAWTLKPMESLYQEHVLPIWNAILDVTVSNTAQEIIVKEGTNVVEPLAATDAAMDTIIHRAVRKWVELAHGNASSDKFVAIFVGYAIMFAMASWYFTRTQTTYGHSFGKVIRDVLRQQGLILKIAFFVAIEMIAFPLFCGIVISLSTLPVFEGATVGTRFAFYLQSPNWSIIMHWLVGTAFMFNFSMFVGVCRGIVRRGVMWFIRDPDDQAFHPVREILERPILLQLRKLGTGALMYLTLIVMGITMTVHGINLLLRGVLPLRWPVDEPISDLPVDLLLFHLVVPLTIRWLKPTRLVKKLFEAWWRKLSQWLRLSSFMFNNQVPEDEEGEVLFGERYPEEEGHVVYRTWKAWFLRSRPPIPGLENTEGSTVGSGEELDIDAPVIFIRDGGLYRVPNTDRVVHLRNRRVLVPVDEQGNALDPTEDLPGEIDPLVEIQPRGRDEVRPPINPKEGTIIVYAPPNFKRRLIAFVMLLWTSVMTFLALAIVGPLVLGRVLFALVTQRQVHDVYSFVAGGYFLSTVWLLLDWASTKLHTISTQGIQPVDIHAQLAICWRIVKAAGKIIFFAMTFGALIPFTLGLMVELFVILPLRTAVDDETGIIFVVNWAVGLLYMKIIHGIATAMPNNRFARDWNRVFATANVEDWDVTLAARRLILPIMARAGLAVGGPVALAWTVTKTLGYEGAARVKIFRLSYPVVFLAYITVFGFKKSVVVLRDWSQYVRDQEYLVGRQLHNLREEEEVQAAETPAQATVDDMIANGTATTAATAPIDIPTPLARSNSRRVRDRSVLDSDVEDADWSAPPRESNDDHEDEEDEYDSLIPALESVRGHDREGKGVDRSSSSSDVFELSGRSSFGHFSAAEEHRVEDEAEEEEDTIAHRTRFRRSQRLQALEETSSSSGGNRGQWR